MCQVEARINRDGSLLPWQSFQTRERANTSLLAVAIDSKDSSPFHFRQLRNDLANFELREARRIHRNTIVPSPASFFPPFSLSNYLQGTVVHCSVGTTEILQRVSRLEMSAIILSGCVSLKSLLIVDWILMISTISIAPLASKDMI